MTTETSTSVLAYVTANPRCTAAEAGITVPQMVELENAGLVKRAGNRVTGKKGRPPIEWVLSSVDTGGSENGAHVVVSAIAKVVTPERTSAHNCKCDFDGITDAIKLTKMGAGCKDPLYVCGVLDAVRREVLNKTPAVKVEEDDE